MGYVAVAVTAVVAILVGGAVAGSKKAPTYGPWGNGVAPHVRAAEGVGGLAVILGIIALVVAIAKLVG